MTTPNTVPGESTGLPTEQPGQTAETPDGTPSESVNEIAKVKADYEAQLANIKKSQAGSDKINAELRKELEEIRKSQMTDKERTEYERKLFEQDRLNLEREKRNLEIAKLKSDYVAENAISPRWRDLLSADTQEGLAAQVDTIKGLIDEAVQEKQLELDALKASLTRPAGGAGAAGNKTMPANEFYALPAKEKAAFMAAGGKLT